MGRLFISNADGDFIENLLKRRKDETRLISDGGVGDHAGCLRTNPTRTHIDAHPTRNRHAKRYCTARYYAHPNPAAGDSAAKNGTGELSFWSGHGV
jgi:hypothetical protein